MTARNINRKQINHGKTLFTFNLLPFTLIMQLAKIGIAL